PLLPISPELLGICSSINRLPWLEERELAGASAPCPLSPLAPRRVRPRTSKTWGALIPWTAFGSLLGSCSPFRYFCWSKRGRATTRRLRRQHPLQLHSRRAVRRRRFRLQG